MLAAMVALLRPLRSGIASTPSCPCPSACRPSCPCSSSSPCWTSCARFSSCAYRVPSFLLVHREPRGGALSDNPLLVIHRQPPRLVPAEGADDFYLVIPPPRFRCVAQTARIVIQGDATPP